MKKVDPEYDYEPTVPSDLKAGHPVQELALKLGIGQSTLVGWRQNGIPTVMNNALRHILFLEAQLARAHRDFDGGDRD